MAGLEKVFNKERRNSLDDGKIVYGVGGQGGAQYNLQRKTS